MESLLYPIYGSLMLQVLFGVLVAANLLLLVRLRYETLLERPEVDRAGLAVYQRSGVWLALFLGFVAAFLPPYLPAAGGGVLALALVTTLLVSRTWGRLDRA